MIVEELRAAERRRQWRPRTDPRRTWLAAASVRAMPLRRVGLLGR